jgi:predicted O-methyltransferase YrrM
LLRHFEMNWLLQNTRERIRFAWQNPAYVARALLREFTLADERFLAAATGVAARDIRRYLDEPVHTPSFIGHLRSQESAFRSAGVAGADLFAKKVLLQYAAIRALRPEVVVETGVASGVSSAYVLLALRNNQQGKLHSIEIGDTSYLPPGKTPGWIVPNGLRDRWEIHFGDSRTLLPELLEQLGTVGVFIHDSLHTYEHMRFEFERAYPHIRPGGLLLADDASWNPAFLEFAQAAKAPLAKILRGVGFLRK